MGTARRVRSSKRGGADRPPERLIDALDEAAVFVELVVVLQPDKAESRFKVARTG